MLSLYQHTRYVLRRKIIALSGIIQVFTPDGEPLLLCRQKPYFLRQELRVSALAGDPPGELLRIRARHLFQTAITYDIYAAGQTPPLGALRRIGWRSLRRDTWSLLDPDGQAIGTLQAQGLGQALVYSGARPVFPPQDYLLQIGEWTAARFRQRYNPLRYEMDLEFMETDAPEGPLDRRVGLAASILLAALAGDSRSTPGIG